MRVTHHIHRLKPHYILPRQIYRCSLCMPLFCWGRLYTGSSGNANLMKSCSASFSSTYHLSMCIWLFLSEQLQSENDCSSGDIHLMKSCSVSFSTTYDLSNEHDAFDSSSERLQSETDYSSGNIHLIMMEILLFHSQHIIWAEPQSETGCSSGGIHLMKSCSASFSSTYHLSMMHLILLLSCRNKITACRSRRNAWLKSLLDRAKHSFSLCICNMVTAAS